MDKDNCISSPAELILPVNQKQTPLPLSAHVIFIEYKGARS